MGIQKYLGENPCGMKLVNLFSYDFLPMLAQSIFDIIASNGFPLEYF